MQRQFVKSVVVATLQVKLQVALAELVTTLQETYDKQLGSTTRHLRPLTCETIEAMVQELVSEGILKKEAPFDMAETSGNSFLQSML